MKKKNISSSIMTLDEYAPYRLSRKSCLDTRTCCSGLYVTVRHEEVWLVASGQRWDMYGVWVDCLSFCHAATDNIKDTAWHRPPVQVNRASTQWPTTAHGANKLTSPIIFPPTAPSAPRRTAHLGKWRCYLLCLVFYEILYSPYL